MIKKYWFGHSLVWIGVLYNSPKPAIAEVISSPALNSVSQEVEQLSSNVVLAGASISPPEVAPLSIERREKDLLLQPDLNTSSHLIGNTFSSDLSEAESQNGTQKDLSNSILVSSPEEPQQADSTEVIDPELGRLRLRENELAIEENSENVSTDDPELGRLRLQESELATQQDVDTVFLIANADYFRSDNILLDDFDLIDDQLIRAGVSLLAVPSLGSQTQLLLSAGGNLAFYSDLSELNYRNLEFRAEIQQTLFPNTYATIGWSNRQFFSADDGDRFLNDHSVRFALSRRDSLASQLTLDSFYQLRLSFADPSDRSRLINTFSASLDYALQPDLTVGLNYQLDLTNFTQQEREDAYHQVTAQLSYDLSRNSRMSLYAGFSFGQSSDSEIDFDSSIVGISFDTFLPLF